MYKNDFQSTFKFTLLYYYRQAIMIIKNLFFYNLFVQVTYLGLLNQHCKFLKFFQAYLHFFFGNLLIVKIILILLAFF